MLTSSELMFTLRQRLDSLVPKGRVAKSILTLAGGTAVGQGVTACAMPFITRLYSPAQIGVISVFLAFFTFWAPALSLRYEYALLIAHDDTESHVINKLAMLCVLGMSVLAMPLLAAMRASDVLGFGLLPSWAAIAALPILFGYGQFMVCRSWGLRAGLMSNITKSTIARSAANALTRIGLGALGGGVPALFAAELAGAWGPAATLYRAVNNRFESSRQRSITIKAVWSVACRYAKFPAYETPSTLVNQLAQSLPVPMIASLYGPQAAGWYGLARAMVGIPNTQIGAAVGDVFQMELARAVIEGDKGRGHRLFYKMVARLSLFGLIPLVTVMSLAPSLMPLLFGQQWRQAGWIAAAIAPWLYAALIVSTLSRLLSVLQAQEFKLWYDIISVVLFGSVFLLAKYLNLSILSMVISLSAAGVTSYFIYFVVIRKVVESRLRGRSS